MTIGKLLSFRRSTVYPAPSSANLSIRFAIQNGILPTANFTRRSSPPADQLPFCQYDPICTIVQNAIGFSLQTFDPDLATRQGSTKQLCRQRSRVTAI